MRTECKSILGLKNSCFPVKSNKAFENITATSFVWTLNRGRYGSTFAIELSYQTIYNQISAIKSIKIPCSHSFTAQTLSNDATSLRPFHFWLNPSYFCFVTFWHWIFHNKWNTAANTKAFEASEWSFTFFLLRCLIARRAKHWDLRKNVINVESTVEKSILSTSPKNLRWRLKEVITKKSSLSTFRGECKVVWWWMPR